MHRIVSFKLPYGSWFYSAHMTIRQFFFCLATKELIRDSFQKGAINAKRKLKKTQGGNANKESVEWVPYSH